MSEEGVKGQERGGDKERINTCLKRGNPVDGSPTRGWGAVTHFKEVH